MEDSNLSKVKDLKLELKQKESEIKVMEKTCAKLISELKKMELEKTKGISSLEIQISIITEKLLLKEEMIDRLEIEKER